MKNAAMGELTYGRVYQRFTLFSRCDIIARMSFFTRLLRSKKRIYLDIGAATPVCREVLDAMRPYFTDVYGNPSAVHAEGQAAHRAVEAARLDVARLLSVRPEDVVFTSGGTESNNLALYGVVAAAHEAGRAYTDMEVISTSIEHPSVLRVLEALAARGVRVTYAPVDAEGKIDVAALTERFTEQTVLVTCAYANSEVGTIQPIKQITKHVRRWNEAHEGKILTHLDASQAPLWLACQLDALGVDLMTLDAGKCYGPKGAGVLARKHHVTLTGTLLGGSQEFGLRAGTENVPLIVGAAAALRRAQEGYAARADRVCKLRDKLFAELDQIPGVVRNGARTDRIANNVNISLLGHDTEFAVVALDTKGIAAATRSACSGADGAGSHVVRTIADEARAVSTLRFTLGEETHWGDLLQTVAVLKRHLATMEPYMGDPVKHAEPKN